MPRKKCPTLLRGLPGFPAIIPGGGGGSSVLGDRVLQVATGYSPGTPLENYQFTNIQSAIDYANGSLSPSITSPVVVQIYPGTYQTNLILYDNVYLLGFEGTIIDGTITYTNTSPNSKIALKNLVVIDSTKDPSTRNDFTITKPVVEIYHDNVIFVTTIFFYCYDGDGTSVDDYIYMTNSTYNNVFFDNIFPKTDPEERTILMSNCLFNRGVAVGFTADPFNVAVVEAIGCTFNDVVQVGNAIVPVVLRANSCTFAKGSSIIALIRGFVNLMNSEIDPSTISGAGTVDMNVLTIPSIELTSVGIPLSFQSDFGITDNTSLGYQVVITALGNTPSMTSADLLTGTGFTAYASVTGDYCVSVIRSFSPI